MLKSRITGLIAYLTAITLGILVIVTSVMLLLETPGSGWQERRETPTVATLKQAVGLKPLPKLTAKDFDISRAIKVVVAGKPEPKTDPAPNQSVLTATIAADAVNLRAAASKQSMRVSVVRRGARVTVHESERSWTRITTQDGVTGWVATKFLAD